MGSLWFKNVFGFHLSDEELQNIPHLKSELLLHITLRTVQASCLFGALVCAPVVTILSAPRTFKCLTQRSARFATYGFLPGVVVSPILMYSKMKNEPIEGFYDRCYRLRCNTNQVRVDRFSYIGLACGGFAGFASHVRPVETSIIGMLIGTVMATCYNQVKSNMIVQR
ncbi:hypothetical protein EWB00_002312 [Schistosoma japonicum]|uniref:SJCHGC05781 protein n=2 Tax=Schistosoma japonicum TaxID=6182 RepID=Q5DE78_SCHJA|nr:SJCHGC05781 protein [Schistosoma japonicum]TNN14046.1 hypothetical protein EWB00_002312 [Schistosoma japonicum]